MTLEDDLEEGVQSWLETRFHISDDALIYKGSDAQITPSSLALLRQFGGPQISLVDLSFGAIGDDLRALEGLFNLRSLVLDNCQLTDQLIVPAITSLRTLSLNKNLLLDLDRLLKGLNIRLPQLEHLSLLSNPLSPHPCLNVKSAGGGSSAAKGEEEYQRFRQYVAFRLPTSLRFLDDRPVTHQDRRLDLGTTITSDDRRPRGGDHRNIQGTSLPSSASSTPGGALNDIGGVLRGRLDSILSRFKLGSEEEEAKKKKKKKQQPTLSFKMRRLDRPSDFSADLGRSSSSSSDVEKQLQQTSSLINPNGKKTRRRRRRRKEEEGRALFGRLKYTYSGKNSEGNRFIKDEDL